MSTYQMHCICTDCDHEGLDTFISATNDFLVPRKCPSCGSEGRWGYSGIRQ